MNGIYSTAYVLLVYIATVNIDRKTIVITLKKTKCRNRIKMHDIWACGNMYSKRCSLRRAQSDCLNAQNNVEETKKKQNNNTTPYTGSGHDVLCVVFAVHANINTHECAGWYFLRAATKTVYDQRVTFIVVHYC